MELNYDGESDELATFFPNGKYELYNDVIPDSLSRDSFLYSINETRDIFFTKIFFQSREYYDSYNPNTSFRKQLIDSFNNDYFRITTEWTQYIEEIDRTMINKLMEEFSRL